MIISLLYALVFLIIATAFYALSAMYKESIRIGLQSISMGFYFVTISFGAGKAFFEEWNILHPIVMGALGMIFGVVFATVNRAMYTNKQELEEVMEAREELETLKVEAKNKGVQRYILDDTSLFHSHMLELLNSFLTTGEVTIPRFCIQKLQAMQADPNASAQSRGMLAMTALEKVLREAMADIVVYEETIEGNTDDDKYLKLSKKLDAVVITGDSDYALILRAKGIRVIALDEMKNALEKNSFVGDIIEIVVSEVHNETQGIGYLFNGIKVLVDDGATYQGKKIRVQISKVYETVAGTMLQANII